MFGNEFVMIYNRNNLLNTIMTTNPSDASMNILDYVVDNHLWRDDAMLLDLLQHVFKVYPTDYHLQLYDKIVTIWIYIDDDGESFKRSAAFAIENILIRNRRDLIGDIEHKPISFESLYDD